MFVLPPPARYPTQAAYNAALAGGHVAPMIETNNILSNPTGPQCHFLVGEGQYVLKEDLLLATPPPHPSEAPVLNPNPLATTPQPATAGTKLSLRSLDARGPPANLAKASADGGARISTPEYPNESESSTDAGLSSEGRGNSSDLASLSAAAAPLVPAFGHGNALLAQGGQPSKDAGKKRKPKNNMTKSNSSFISRVIIHESLSKRLQERGADALFAFANINRAFQWLDLSSPNKADYLTKILFTKAHCLCHDVNKHTKSASHIDVIMGFSTGEFIWWEPISQRYTRLNKNGITNGSPVSEIRWIPGSENLFLAAHMDGSLIVYDKEKEDAAFSPEEEEASKEGIGNGNGNGNGKEKDKEKDSIDPATAEAACSAGVSTSAAPGRATAPPLKTPPFNYRAAVQVLKSVHSKNQKFNPVTVWKLSNSPINAFAFSPDNKHLAVVTEEGTLRIIDYLNEELLDLYSSYYGGLTCVCWSPDGKYVLTGGQDDLISIWYVAEAVLIARCQGHHSWVTSVAFDPWRCDDKNYRFGSVGDDCRLCLWDFNVGMLHMPKNGRAAAIRNSAKASGVALPLYTAETQSSRARSNSTASSQSTRRVRDHSPEPRSRVANLPAIFSRAVDKDPLCWVGFTEDAIITGGKTGRIRTWSRPADGAVVAPL